MDRIEGDIDADATNVAVGKNNTQISIHADTLTWREFVRRDIADLREDVEDLKRWCRGLMIAVMIAFALGAITTALAIRQFDQSNGRIDANLRRLDQVERQLIIRDSGIPFP